MPANSLAERLATYTALNAPTGFEEPVLKAAQDELHKTCERVEVDVRGNVYGFQSGTDPDGLVVMITGHADEIGFLTTTILPGGELRIAKLGGPTSTVLPGQKVTVLTEKGFIPGAIGAKAAHVLTVEESHRVPPIHDLYVDIGATSAEEAASWGVEPGAPIVFFGPLTQTNHPHRFFGKCVDNRIGVLSTLVAAERMQSMELPAHRVYAIVVEEEIGLRGAAVAAKHIDPDVVIALDTVPAGGTPDVRDDKLPWKVGDGVLLKVRESKGYSSHGPLRKLIRDVAERNNIPHKVIVDTAGVTDATAAQQASGKVAAVTLGLARKYAHSAVELFDLRDMEAMIDLTCKTTAALLNREQLMRL